MFFVLCFWLIDKHRITLYICRGFDVSPEPTHTIKKARVQISITCTKDLEWLYTRGSLRPRTPSPQRAQGDRSHRARLSSPHRHYAPNIPPRDRRSHQTSTGTTRSGLMTSQLAYTHTSLSYTLHSNSSSGQATYSGHPQCGLLL